MLMVSHDRYFINKLADRIVYLNENGTVNYDGDYDAYYEKTRQIKQEAVQKTEKVSDYHERKRLEAQKRKVLNDFSKTENKISELEDVLSKLSNELSDCGADYIKAAEITEKTEKTEAELEALYAEWERLQEEIEEKGYNL